MIFVEIVVQFYWFRTRPYLVAALLNVGIFVICYVLCGPPSNTLQYEASPNQEVSSDHSKSLQWESYHLYFHKHSLSVLHRLVICVWFLITFFVYN